MTPVSALITGLSQIHSALLELLLDQDAALTPEDRRSLVTLLQRLAHRQERLVAQREAEQGWEERYA